MNNSISTATCGVAHLDGIRLFNYLQTQSRQSNIILGLWQVFSLSLLHFVSQICQILFHFLPFLITCKPNLARATLFWNFDKFLQISRETQTKLKRQIKLRILGLHLYENRLRFGMSIWISHTFGPYLFVRAQ